MIALAKAADSANVISGQGTLDVLRYGSILPARTVVQVQGAGITYDGEYFVSSVTHTIKPGFLQAELHAAAQPADRRQRAGPGRAIGLGQQLPAFSSAAGQAASPPPGAPVPAPLPAPPLPGPGPALPVPAPAGPAVPVTSGASITSSLPASPTS